MQALEYGMLLNGRMALKIFELNKGEPGHGRNYDL